VNELSYLIKRDMVIVAVLCVVGLLVWIGVQL